MNGEFLTHRLVTFVEVFRRGSHETLGRPVPRIIILVEP